MNEWIREWDRFNWSNQETISNEWKQKNIFWSRYILKRENRSHFII